MNPRADYIYQVAIWICVIVSIAYGSVQSKVRCSEDAMEVDIVRSSPEARIYLEQLKNYPDEACKPKLSKGVATFHLSLQEEEMMRCGLTRVVNTVTGQKVYYHRIIVEEPAEPSKHTFTVKCVITEVTVPQQATSGSTLSLNHTIVRRRSLPDDFEEPHSIAITHEYEGMAPVPILGVGVRQGGTLVTGELNVSPGTPLQMEIYLDTTSARVYGILVTHMQVSDTKTQEETIIFNGCSLDPYLFENFNTIDGDFLNAKFRAFKFPESTYVQFRGTVNVCLEQCEGIQCNNGQVGYGRKRRAILPPNGNTTGVYKVTMSTFIKVDLEGDAEMNEALLEFVLKPKNSTDDRPIIAKEVRKQFEYRVIEEEEEATSAGNFQASSIFVVIFCLLQVL